MEKRITACQTLSSIVEDIFRKSDCFNGHSIPREYLAFKMHHHYLIISEASVQVSPILLFMTTWRN